MESQRLGGAESLIRGEAIRFMQQKKAAEQGPQWDMVVFEPESTQSSQPESSSSEPSPTKSSKNIVEEIMMKYGLKRPNHPPIVIAKPIPASSGQEMKKSFSSAIDQSVRKAKLAKLQKENEERQKERERKKKHKP